MSRDKRYIDPLFYIPEGIPPEVWAYNEEDGVQYDEEVDIFESVDEGEDSEDDGLLTIDNLTIVSQTLRRLKDGSLVVDMVVQVDDIPGATKYEFRITKT